MHDNCDCNTRSCDVASNYVILHGLLLSNNQNNINLKVEICWCNLAIIYATITRSAVHTIFGFPRLLMYNTIGKSMWNEVSKLYIWRFHMPGIIVQYHTTPGPERNFSKQYTQRVVDTDNRKDIHNHVSMHIQRNEYDSRLITVKCDQRCQIFY